MHHREDANFIVVLAIQQLLEKSMHQLSTDSTLQLRGSHWVSVNLGQRDLHDVRKPFTKATRNRFIEHERIMQLRFR